MRSTSWTTLFISVAVGLAATGGCLDRAAVTAYKPVVEAPSDDALRERIDAIIGFTRDQRLMAANEQAAWQVVHGLEAYGRDLKLDADGQTVGALDYLLEGRPLKGWNLRPGDHGLIAIQEPGSKTGQGHPDQWLGYLSQCGVGLGEPLVVGGKTYHVRDLLTQAQWDIYDGMEATWTLMAAITYLPLDAHWKAKDGSQWSIERIVNMETDQPAGTGGCGDTHRMYALALAVSRYVREHKVADETQLPAPWNKTLGRIQKNVAIVERFQDPDGTLSTRMFEGPSRATDLGSKLYAGGHTLEFLTVALSPEDLRSEWVTKAVTRLCEQMEAMKDLNPDCGALYHGAHGLMLYRKARFGAPTAAPKETASNSVLPSPRGGERGRG